MKRILIIVVLLFCYSQNHIATADVGVLNLRNYYGSYPIEDHQSINPENNHLSHQLVFSMDNSSITAEFKNVDDVKKFKNHAVDVYGLSYSGYCLKNKYIYGGVTLAGDYLEKSRCIPINLWVNGEHQTISTDKVSTNKKLVTAQEIDVKLRRYLQEEYNIYGHNNTGKGKEYGYKSKFYSGFNNGKVLFHLNNEKSFSYDLFYTGDGLPVSFLKIYEDNKIIESEKFHLDVEISYVDSN
ncbi:TPA: exotoxin [Staphylococcus aureus]|uniref:Enterotoxin-like V n=1 Tax=Staphylococcus aureus TaxID=1280 RepID=A0FKY6_STAAU|nr:staphylococcal enterotoxin type V [Staphylococcus aureus]ABK27165.1 enterotoxin-like V [Staphylococcus aureus]KIT67234.1 enterotoxin I [Staphylococcus aureus]HAZ5480946.1 exotoxin [Staphylococcus aureus]HCV0559123.1 exotoxin [Staphylococcus aureus]HCV6799296.1 exotoxin [Staphylococcus aureus]